jgi:hypothetical protein
VSNTVVQIKRSNTTATPANLVYGELAYSLVSNNLFIGTDANTVIKIGGGSDVALLNVTPGILTNSAALVVNSTGGVDTLTIGNFTVSSQTNENLDVTQNVTANVISSNTITSGNGNFTDVNVSNTLTVNGDIVLRGDNISLGDGGDVISLGASVNNNIVPTTDDTFTLGTSSQNYKTVFANQVTLGSAPSNDTDAATKAYVDNISASLIGNAISIGVPTDGIFANGQGSGNIEGAVTSLSNTTSVADAIDSMNEVMFNIHQQTYVRDVVVTCTSGNTGGAPLTATLTINVVGNANAFDINWGDGSYTNNTNDSTPSHTYTDNTNSPFDITVTAKNTGALGEGNSASQSVTDLITLYTADPNADFDIYNVSSGGSEITEANTNETIYLDNETTNANDVTATFFIRWGDGSNDSVANTSVAGGTQGDRISHTYTSGTGTGSNTIQLSINTHSTADPSALPDTASKTIKIFDTSIAAPEGLSGKSFSFTSSSVGTSPKLAQGHIDHSSESTLGEGDSVTRYTTTGAIQTSGEANSQVVYNAGAGALSAIVDGSIDGTINFTSGDDTGSNASVVVVDELDFYNFDNLGRSISASARRYAQGLYSGFRARISKSSVATGLHTYKLSHSTTGNTSVLQFVKDNLTGTPVINLSGTTVTQNSAGTLAYVSGIPYYTNDATINIVGALVSNVAGQTYKDDSTPFNFYSGTDVEGDSGSAFSTQTKDYTILPPGSLSSGKPKANTGVGANVTIDTFQLSVNGGGRRVEGFAMNMENVNGAGANVQYANTKIAVYNGTSSGVNESSIPVSDSLGAGFDTDGLRIVTGWSGSTPAFSSGQDYYASNNWSGAVTIAGTDEAVVRYGNLQHYDTDLSSGYLPVGPDLNTGRSGSQYFRFAFKRTTMSNFTVKLTGKVSGFFIAAPNTDIDDTSDSNGWLNASATYAGAGTPGANTTAGGNGSDGCAFTSGDRIIDGTTYSNQGFTLTLGDQNASDSYNNQILVGIKLDDGDYLSQLEVE